MRAEQLAVLEAAVEETPSEAWSGITPQLLSLLQHGQPWLRTFVGKLLARSAHQWPHLLLFPVAVGAAGLTGYYSLLKQPPSFIYYFIELN